MKRVCLVCADFPPSSYPPSLRVRFFARHLPAFGWEPIILTVRPDCYEWSVDPENEQLLPPGLEVVRTGAWSVAWTRKVGLGDLGLRSLTRQWSGLRGLCATRELDLVFVPLPPFYSPLLGRWAWDQFRVPYVMDYIDPWVSDYWKREPAARRFSKRGLADALARWLEPYALRHVGHLVGVSKKTTDDVLARYPWLQSCGTTEIPYGGEPADFDYLRSHPRANPFFAKGDGLLHVSYVGRGGYDMRPALKGLFLAHKAGLAANPALFARARFHFIGTSYAAADGQPQVLALARELGVADYVQEHPGRIAFLDALQVLLDSHALVVPGSDAPHYTASKIFPYILAARPLLAVFHAASSVVEILRETQAGQVVTFTNDRPPELQVEAIRRGLETLLSHPRDANPPTRWSAFEPYTARAMTQRLASVFDRVAAEKPALVPCPV